MASKKSSKGNNLAIGLAIGLAFGAYFGQMSDNLPFWAIMGTGLGIAIGTYMERARLTL